VEGWVGEDFPNSIPFSLTMSSLIPRRCHRPSVRSGLRSLARHDDAGFIHEIGIRPPQHSLRGYQCVHLRYNLVSCVAPFQVTLSSRLLCNRFQPHTDSLPAARQTAQRARPNGCCVTLSCSAGRAGQAGSLRGFRVLPCSGLAVDRCLFRTRIELEQLTLALILKEATFCSARNLLPASPQLGGPVGGRSRRRSANVTRQTPPPCTLPPQPHQLLSPPLAQAC
jgi:hypothetical protein